MSDEEVEQLAAKAIKREAFDNAVQLLTPLAKRNNEYALRTLGWIYETGALGTPDLAVARAYYERAVEHDSLGAFAELGWLFLQQGDERQALATFIAGAEKGDLSSMSRAGKLLAIGNDNPADKQKGMSWLMDASARGHIMAQRTLLGIEYGDTRRIFQKLIIMGKVAALAAKGGWKMFKNPDADILR